MKPKIVEENPLSSAEVREILEKIKKDSGELSFRSQKTLEHLEAVASLKKKQSDELFQEIEKIKIPRLREHHIYKIIDLMPKTVEELKAFFQAYTISLNQEQSKKIVEILNSVK